MLDKSSLVFKTAKLLFYLVISTAGLKSLPAYAETPRKQAYL